MKREFKVGDSVVTHAQEYKGTIHSIDGGWARIMYDNKIIGTFEIKKCRHLVKRKRKAREFMVSYSITGGLEVRLVNGDLKYSKEEILVKEVLPTKPKPGIRLTREKLVEAWNNLDTSRLKHSNESVNALAKALGFPEEK